MLLQTSDQNEIEVINNGIERCGLLMADTTEMLMLKSAKTHGNSLANNCVVHTTGVCI